MSGFGNDRLLSLNSEIYNRGPMHSSLSSSILVTFFFSMAGVAAGCGQILPDSRIQPFLEDHCFDCHDSATQPIIPWVLLR